MSENRPKPDPALDPSTLAARALGWIEPTTRGLVPPIHLATTFERAADQSLPGGRSYIRPLAPGFDQPEALLAALEGGRAAMLYASGMAAATAAFMALRPGDHALAPREGYWGLRQWLIDFGRPAGLAIDFVEMSDLAAVRAAVRPGRTRLIWIETPANPTWTIADIEGLAGIARRAGARLAVDSTAATPVHTRPLALGADLVMHAATKYLNGHSDVLCGALVTAAPDDEFWQRLASLRAQAGAVPGPFEAWLLLRGMRTLYLRVRQSSASAAAIARHFAGHRKLVSVLYPGLPTHPGHDVAARQMQGGFGGMLSIRVSGGAEAALAVAARVRLWTRATSLGGVESLIEHRASIEGPHSAAPPDLLRLSVGIEHVGDLIADLEQGLG
jgi:cystathionine gamma-synthase